MTKVLRRLQFGRATGFSLVELLVAVSIMSGIIFVLYSVFDQTQRVLRKSISQVDVLETGRAAVSLLAREMEQMAAGRITNSFRLRDGVNFHTRMAGNSHLQVLADGQQVHTNVLDDLFFLSRVGSTWTGNGYRILDAENGVGTLSRYSVSTNARDLTSFNLYQQYSDALATNYQRMAEGVIHFRILAFDRNGHPLLFNDRRHQNLRSAIHTIEGQRVQSVWINAPTNRPGNVTLAEKGSDQTEVICRSNALPAYVELELGILDPVAYSQYKAILNNQVARDYLANQAGRVHLFRQRIPILNAVQ